MQAWYQLDIPVGAAGGNLGQVEVTVGKIDPFGFFDGNNIADDESEGFMNLAFVNNPLLDAGGDIGVGTHGASPGVRMAYVSDINGGNHVTASLGLFGAGAVADYRNSFSKPLTIAQVEYAGKTWKGLSGAYRIYGWNNANTFDQVNDFDANGEFDDNSE
jgi:high affinity Mn2+ porin